jgi:hypothetical protein
MKKIFLLAFSLFAVSAMNAQTGLMGYGSMATTAAQSANPAMTGGARFVLGGNVGIEMKNSFILGDNFTTISGKKYLDLSKFANTLDTKNTLNLGIDADLFHLGFKIGKNFWSLGTQMYQYTGFSFSKDLVKLAAEGNASNPNISLNQESFNMLAFGSLYLGFSRTMLDGKLKIGVRAKQLQGLAMLQTDRFNLNIATNPNSSPAYEMTLRSDIQLQGAGVVGIALDSTLNAKYTSGYNSELTNFGKGFGFDLGAEMQVTKKLRVSASAINLGGNIAWNNAFSRQLNVGGSGQFQFSGIVRDLSGDNPDVKKEVDSIRASAERQLDTKTTATTGVSTQVPTMIFLAATYQLTEKQSVTAIYRNHSYANQSHNVLGVKYQIAPWRSLQLMAGVTLPSNAPVGFGGGIVWSPGPLQLYVMADNISGAMAVDQNKHFQFQAGLAIRLKEKTASTTSAPAPEKK